jgi:hypothetical protein
VVGRQSDDQITAHERRNVWQRHQTAIGLACERVYAALDFVSVLNMDCDRLHP